MSENYDYKAFDEGGADELLRKSMEGYRVEPSPGLWKSISRKLLRNELIRFNFTNLSPKAWLAGSLGLLLIVTVLYVGTRGVPDLVIPAPLPTVPVGVGPSGPAREGQTSATPASTSHVSHVEQPVTKQPVHAKDSFLSALTAPKAKPVLIASAQPVRSGSKYNVVNEPVESLSRAGSVPSTGYETTLAANEGLVHVIPLKGFVQCTPPVADTIITISNASGVLKFRKDKQASGQFFSAGLGITPEAAFYSQPDAYSKINVWMNGAFTYHISRFSVSTGAGLGYVYDLGKYKVDYKSHDSIGYYTGVTSYSIGNDGEIHYNTQTVSVYDSLQHQSDYRTNNRYAYLQVPLLFGYRLFESNRVSLTFEAGPAVSVLLGSRKSDPVINYQNATIIRVDDDTPVRRSVNWQVWANLYLELRMTRQISLYFEPGFKYYLKPMAEQEGVTFKAPLTVGLGVGLQFNFGQKKTRP